MRQEGKKDMQETTRTDEVAAERVRQSARTSHDAIKGAKERQSRFWREIEHADKVMGERR